LQHKTDIHRKDADIKEIEHKYNIVQKDKINELLIKENENNMFKKIWK
jgi:hypothetical protein